MRKMQGVFGLAAVILFSAMLLHAADQKNGTKRSVRAISSGGPFSTLMNINNVSMWISHDGASARNPSTTNAGVTYPRGTSTTIYSDGFVWGGFVHDGDPQILRVNGGTYQEGTVGGRILSKGLAEAPGDPTVRIYRIRRDYATADLRQDAAEILSKGLKDVTDGDIQALRDQYKQDWLNWPWQKGAPYYDRNGNGTYDPDASGDYDPTKDEPGVAGADQVVWFVMNDLNSAQSQSFEGSDPIGLEVQVTLWGYARADQLGNVVFKQYKFIYKGTAGGSAHSTIDSMYVGQWADPDLGDYSDDYVGCDTLRDVFGGLGKVTNLGFVYNSTTLDRNFTPFNLAPPSMGYDFFAGPVVSSPGDSAVFDLGYRHDLKNLGMSSWIYFAASGIYSDPPFNYIGAGQWYNLLRGLTPVDGTPFAYPVTPTTSEVTKFWLSGDPVAQSGNLDGVVDVAGDRRMMLSTGPFSMALGDTQTVVVALVGGIGSDRLSSVSALRFNDLSAQFAFDNLFELPKAPPSPKFRIAQLDKELVLDWGFDRDAAAATENDVNKGYEFEGYNVYQLPSATSTADQAIKIATFDLKNNTVTILDPVFDAPSGQVLIKPVEIGRNQGIQRYLVVDQDKVGNKPLVNGQSYFFAVTAYNNYAGTGAVPVHALENPLLSQTQRAVPQSPNPGVRYHTSANQIVDLSPPTVHVSGISEILPTVTVLEPSRITGDTYQLVFETDTSDGIFKWELRDSTRGDTLLFRSSNFGTNVSGDANDDYRFPIIDGMLFQVKEEVPALKQDSTRWVSPNPVWIEGISFNADPSEAFGGGVTTGAQLGANYLGHFASNFNPFFSFPVEVRFGASQKAYRLRRNGPPGTAYIIQPTNGYADIPFSVFDISNPSNPRQLAVAWRDQDGDGTWNPPVDGDGSEFVFIYAKTYSPDGTGQFSLPPDAVSDECTVGAKADVVYGLSLGVVPGHTLNESAGTLRIIPFLHLTPNDKFVFTPPKATSAVGPAKEDVAKINVFPNPYYGFNRSESDRFHRFVTFNHLPPGDWRIRIISLAGDLVRYIDPLPPQDPASQFATWDLNNQNGLPVASGIYIAFIEMPKLGETKTLKIVIIQEQQILDYY